MKFTKMALALLFVAGSAQAGSFGKSVGGSFLGTTLANTVTAPRYESYRSESRRIRRLERENEDLRDEIASLKRRCRR